MALIFGEENQEREEIMLCHEGPQRHKPDSILPHSASRLARPIISADSMQAASVPLMCCRHLGYYTLI